MPGVSPSPAPAPAAAPGGRIAAGSVLSLRAISQLCTDKSKVGDRVKASLERSITGTGGAALPQGTLVTFVVDQLKRGDEQAKQNTVFSVAPESIEIAGVPYALNAKLDTVVLKKKSRGLLGALVGAAAGVAATKAAGGSTAEAVAVGAAGGVAGAVVGGQLQHGDGCIEKNGLLRITLRDDLTLRAP
jgi:outer membrane lipoprotein SlyB